jgi:hypothetical protein
VHRGARARGTHRIRADRSRSSTALPPA